MRVYIGFALVVILIGALTGIYELYYLVYISLGVCAVVILLTKQAIKNFAVDRELEKDRIFRGETAEVEVSLENDSIWPIFWLSYQEKVPIRLRPPLQSEVISLLPREDWEVSYTLQGKLRGFYYLGPLEIEIGDGLGFVEENLKYSADQEFIVYPQIHPLDELGLPSRIVFGDVIWPQKIYRDPTEFRGLREYNQGDQLRDIYWPATASTGELMVKEYESTVAVENMICLNLKQDDYGVKQLEQQTELAIEAAASVANYLIQAGQTVGVASNGEDPIEKLKQIRPGQGMNHLLEIMEWLARLQVTKEEPLLPVVERQSRNVPPGSTLLIITKIDSEELVERVMQLCRQGLNVVIIVLGTEVLHPQYLNRSYTENLVIYKLNQQKDIYGWGE